MEENFIRMKSRVEIILYIVLAGGVSLYAGERIGHALWHVSGWNCTVLTSVFCAVSMLLILFQGAVKIPRNRSFTACYRIVTWMSSLYVAYLIYLFLSLVPLDILVLIEKIPGFPLQWLDFTNDFLMGTGVSAGFLIYGMIHARSLNTIQYSAAIPGLNRPLRIVQLSDLHMGSVIGKSPIRKIAARANALHPDLIAITGDLFNHNDVRECAHPDELSKILKGLHSTYGTFAVTGNHDPSPGDPKFREFLQNADITLLNNETIELPSIYLTGRTGNTLKHRPLMHTWFSRPVPQAGHAPKPAVLLDHYPDSFIEAEELGFSLLLAGHTHNGQYFPCNYLIRRRYRGTLRHGYTQIRHVKCIVSSGSGFFQIPIRVGTDSEIVCVDLVPDAAFPSDKRMPGKA